MVRNFLWDDYSWTLNYESLLYYRPFRLLAKIDIFSHEHIHDYWYHVLFWQWYVIMDWLCSIDAKQCFDVYWMKFHTCSVCLHLWVEGTIWDIWIQYYIENLLFFCFGRSGSRIPLFGIRLPMLIIQNSYFRMSGCGYHYLIFKYQS